MNYIISLHSSSSQTDTYSDAHEIPSFMHPYHDNTNRPLGPIMSHLNIVHTLMFYFNDTALCIKNNKMRLIYNPKI